MLCLTNSISGVVWASQEELRPYIRHPVLARDRLGIFIVIVFLVLFSAGANTFTISVPAGTYIAFAYFELVALLKLQIAGTQLILLEQDKRLLLHHLFIIMSIYQQSLV